VQAKLRLKIIQDDLPEVKPQNQSPPDRPQHFSPEDPQTPATEQQTPRTNVPYMLNIDGAITQGNTDGNGMVEVSIPPNTRTGRLTLEPETLKETTLDLNLGWLDPADSVTAVKQRLANFGFDSGDHSSDKTIGFQDALRAFQESRGLDITGEIDDSTRNRLKHEHGS
jgi:hypothetical protein